MKRPFKSLGDPQGRARMKQDPDWYTASTADAIVQIGGRIIRSDTDYGVVFIIDGQFSWFASRNGKFFADWWKEAVVRIETLDQAVLPPQMRKDKSG